MNVTMYNYTNYLFPFITGDIRVIALQCFDDTQAYISGIADFNCNKIVTATLSLTHHKGSLEYNAATCDQLLKLIGCE